MAVEVDGASSEVLVSCCMTIGQEDEIGLGENVAVVFAQVDSGCGNLEVNEEPVVKIEFVGESVNRSRMSREWWLTGRKRATRRSYLED